MDAGSDNVDLLNMWRSIQRRWRFILFFTAVVTGSGIMISLILPKAYTSKAILLPLSNGSGSAGSAQSLLGGLSLGGLAPGKSQHSELMAVLESRSLAEMVIQDYDLLPQLYSTLWDKKNNRWKANDSNHQPTIDDAANMLKGAVVVKDDPKRGTITLTTEQPTPQLAYDVAIGYIKTLQKYVAENALTQAKYKRISLGKQLSDNRKALLVAGKNFTEYYGRGNISSVESNVDVDVDDNGNPDTESFGNTDEGGLNIALINDALKRSNSLRTKKNAAPIRRVPQQVYLQYLSLQKDILARTNAMLTQQFEMSKIEEVKDDLLFQVIDKPLMPKRKSKPRRGVIVIAFFFGSLFLSVAGSVALGQRSFLKQNFSNRFLRFLCL